MQMLCKVSHVFSDVRCPSCGQGFLVYWTRTREINRAEQRAHLQGLLAQQHAEENSANAHAPAFHLPEMPVPVTAHVPAALQTPSLAVYS